MTDIEKPKNIKIYIISLFASLIYFCIFFLVYFVMPLSVPGTHIDYGVVTLLFVLPLLILYMLGPYMISISEERKRNIVGWIMIVYAFLYNVSMWDLLFSGVSAPSSNSGSLKPSYVVEDIIFLLNLAMIWYIFIIPIFLKYKMKKHLCGACISLLIIIIIFLLNEVII